MDKLAVVHMSPFVIGAMPCRGILRAAASGLAAQLHAFDEGAGAQIVDGAYAFAYAGDTSSGLFHFLCGMSRHGY